MRYYIYGEVMFTTTPKRAAAARRLDNRAGRAGFVAEAWASMPAGHVAFDKVDDAGVMRPGLRFCYVTNSFEIASQAQEEVTAVWDVFQDSDSYWAYVAVPVTG